MISLRIRVRVNAAFRAKDKTRGVYAPLNPNKRIQKHMKYIVPVIAVATVMTLGAWTPLSAEEEKEEAINMSDVPAAVQKTFNAEAAGGQIVRVEKEESNYEAVIEKDGKQTGVEVSPDGKVVSRHDEKKEHKEKGEKGEKY